MCICMHVCVHVCTGMYACPLRCVSPRGSGDTGGSTHTLEPSETDEETESSFEVSVGGAWPLPYPVCACVYYCTLV